MGRCERTENIWQNPFVSIKKYTQSKEIIGLKLENEREK